ncbi:MAG: hypothetical protein D6800_00920, partial [Candidatus Zixiibacteriota bacterium]
MSTTCRREGTSLHRLTTRRFRRSPVPFRFAYRYHGHWLEGLQSALAGDHQIRNAALVLRAVELLEDFGLTIGKKAIRDGLQQTNWPGRFQVFKRRHQP